MEFRVGKHFLFTEKYRPRKVEDCILPDRILNVLSKVVEDRKIPNMLFEGPPGTGKTTAARAICETIGIDYMIINGSEERGIDVLRNKIMDFAGTISLSGTGKCIIIDEADGLTPEAQAAFRGVIEKFADHCTFILTCNYTQKLIDAIVSRMATVSFYFTKGETDLLQIEMFKRVKAILKNENVSFSRYVSQRICARISTNAPPYANRWGTSLAKPLRLTHTIWQHSTNPNSRGADWCPFKASALRSSS